MKNKKELYKNLDIISSNNSNNFNNIIFSFYSFIKSLHDKLVLNNYNEVFFLSREGEFLKKLFDLYNEKYGCKVIKSNYLYVSRKATYLPSLEEISAEDFSYLLNQYNEISSYEFLSSLNFSKEEINIINKDLKIDLNKKIPKFNKSVEFISIKENEKFKSLFEEKRISQNKLFKKYIKSFTESKNIAVVDIGWNGSIQDNIQNILGSSYNVYGYYFGLKLRSKKYAGNKEGLVFSNYPVDNDKVKLYDENRTIFEYLCGASHGSANYYYEKNNKVLVDLYEKTEEKTNYNKIIKPLQEKMIKTFIKLCDLLINNDYDTNDYNLYTNNLIFNMFYKPNKSQVNFFLKIKHYENFGIFTFADIEKKYSFKKWIKEYIKFFIKSKNFFYDAYWPVLKLIQNNMRFPYLIYKFKNKRKFKKSNTI